MGQSQTGQHHWDQSPEEPGWSQVARPTTLRTARAEHLRQGGPVADWRPDLQGPWARTVYRSQVARPLAPLRDRNTCDKEGKQAFLFLAEPQALDDDVLVVPPREDVDPADRGERDEVKAIGLVELVGAGHASRT